MTHYDVLGVSSDADADVIRRAYRRLARQTHPDRGGTADQFDAVRAAWVELSDPGRRERYDLALAGGPSPTEAGPTRPDVDDADGEPPEPGWGEEQPLDASAPPARPQPAPHPDGPGPDDHRNHPAALPPHWVGSRPPLPPVGGWRALPWSWIAAAGGGLAVLSCLLDSLLQHRTGTVVAGTLAVVAPAAAARRLRDGRGGKGAWRVVRIGATLALLGALFTRGAGDAAPWASALTPLLRTSLAVWSLALPLSTTLTRDARAARARHEARFDAYLVWLDSRRALAEQWERFVRSPAFAERGAWWVEHRQPSGSTTAVLLRAASGQHVLNTWVWGAVPLHAWVVLDDENHVVVDTVPGSARQAWTDVHADPRPAFVPDPP
jgi:hypothetical protein